MAPTGTGTAIQRPSRPSKPKLSTCTRTTWIGCLAVRMMDHDAADPVAGRAFAAVGDFRVGVKHAVRRLSVFGFERRGETRSTCGVTSLHSAEGGKRDFVERQREISADRRLDGILPIGQPMRGAFGFGDRIEGGQQAGISAHVECSRRAAAAFCGGFAARTLARPAVLVIDAHPDRRVGQERVLARVDEEDVRIGKAGAVLNAVFLEGKDTAVRRKADRLERGDIAGARRIAQTSAECKTARQRSRPKISPAASFGSCCAECRWFCDRRQHEPPLKIAEPATKTLAPAAAGKRDRVQRDAAIDLKVDRPIADHRPDAADLFFHGAE